MDTVREQLSELISAAAKVPDDERCSWVLDQASVRSGYAESAPTAKRIHARRTLILEPLLERTKKERERVCVLDLLLTFLAAALKASLWVMSGLPAFMRWISSLQKKSDECSTLSIGSDLNEQNLKRRKNADYSTFPNVTYLMKRLYAEGTLCRFSGAATNKS